MAFVSHVHAGTYILEPGFEDNDRLLIMMESMMTEEELQSGLRKEWNEKEAERTNNSPTMVGEIQ